MKQKVEELTNQNSAVFRILSTEKEEHEILIEILEALKTSLKNANVKYEDQIFQIFKLFMKVKFKEDVLAALRKIGNKDIEIRKLPTRRRLPAMQ